MDARKIDEDLCELLTSGQLPEYDPHYFDEAQRAYRRELKGKPVKNPPENYKAYVKYLAEDDLKAGVLQRKERWEKFGHFSLIVTTLGGIAAIVNLFLYLFMH